MTPTSGQSERVKGQSGSLARLYFYLFPLAFLLIAAPAAMGCPVCWGAPDDPMVKSVNKGIYVLLGIVGFVQIGFVALFWSFWRRAKEQQRFRESLHVIHQFDKGGPLS